MSAATMLQVLTDLADDLLSEYETECKDLNFEARTLLLAGVRECRAKLASGLEAALVYDIAHDAPRRYVVEGLGEVAVHHKIRRTRWDNDQLTKVVVARALDERVVTEDGEVEPGWETVTRVLSECMRPSWRLTPLKARGIDPDEYCETTTDGYSVELPPAKART